MLLSSRVAVQKPEPSADSTQFLLNQIECLNGGVIAAHEEIRKLNQENDSLGEKISALVGDIRGLKAENGELRRENSHLKGKFSELHIQLSELDGEVAKNQRVIACLTQDIREMNDVTDKTINGIAFGLADTLKHGGRRDQTTRAVVVSEESQTEKTKKIFGVALDKIESLRKKRDAARARVNELETNWMDSEAHLKSLRVDLADKVRSLDEANKRLNAKMASKDAKAPLKNQVLAAQAEVAAIQAENANLWTQNAQKDDQIANLQVQLAAAQARMAQQNADLQRMAAKNLELVQVLTDNEISMG
jgi:chromosome segregation ATPase